jgi:phosphate transport system substrate-binding protein
LARWSTYNVEGVTEPLRFTPLPWPDLPRHDHEVNDPCHREIESGVRLPSADILVVHARTARTTYVWTDYLSKISETWKTKVGRNTSVNWPVGLGGKGNEGVAGLVKQTPDSVGYVELIYAVQNKLPYGLVQNASGEFVKADLPSVTAAAGAFAKAMPADFRVSITNPPGKGAYPIASFTWLLVPANPADARKGRVIVDFLKWMLTDGQKMTEALSYAPLPRDVVQLVQRSLGQIRVPAAR